MLSCALIHSCGYNDPKSPKPVSSNEFFSIEPWERDESLEEYILGLKKESLGKEFTLQTNMVLGTSNPQFTGMKTRIVIFSLVSGKLLLEEVANDHVLHDALPQRMPLALIPIVRETDSHIFFDFGAGMDKVFSLTDWFFSDVLNTEHAGVENHLSQESIANSFVDQAETKGSRLRISQRGTVSSEEGAVPVHIKYQFTPWKENKAFVNKATEHHHKGQFFRAHPYYSQKESKHIANYAKFDMSKTITFALSSNTPKKYRKPLMDGILYWNKVFGRKVVDVIMAPEGVSAPNYDYNMIQWIDWKEAPFAYADAQLDPRSGEVMNAQIYMPRSFVNYDRKDLQRVLNNLDAGAIGELRDLTQGSDIVKLDAFKNLFQQHRADHKNHGHLCAERADQASEVAHLDEDEFDRVIGYKLVKVAAHEVGHVLGLSHNFAGYLEGTLDDSQRKTIISKLVAGESVAPDFSVGSTVMDYYNFSDSVLIGFLATHSDKPFPYDVEAINSLYYHKETPLDQLVPFCNDLGKWEYVNCKTHASNKNIFKQAEKELNGVEGQIPRALAEILKQPSTSIKTHLDQVKSLAFQFAMRSSMRRAEVLELFSGEKHFVADQSGMSNREHLAKQYEEFGDINRLFPENAPAAVGKRILVAVSRYFSANPELLELLQKQSSVQTMQKFIAEYALYLGFFDLLGFVWHDDVLLDSLQNAETDYQKQVSVLMLNRLANYLSKHEGVEPAIGNVMTSVEFNPEVLKQFTLSKESQVRIMMNKMGIKDSVQLLEGQLKELALKLDLPLVVEPDEGSTELDASQFVVLPAVFSLPSYSYPKPVRLFAARIAASFDPFAHIGFRMLREQYKDVVGTALQGADIETMLSMHQNPKFLKWVHGEHVMMKVLFGNPKEEN